MFYNSVVILNYGLHLARSTSFEKYKQLIYEIIKVFAKYQGEAVWRTTTSIWRQHAKVHKRFQTNQVIAFAYRKSVADCKMLERLNE